VRAIAISTMLLTLSCLACSAPQIIGRVRIGGRVVAEADGREVELTEVQRLGALELACEEVSVEEYVRGDVVRVSGCGRRTLWVRAVCDPLWIRSGECGGLEHSGGAIVSVADVRYVPLGHGTPDGVRPQRFATLVEVNIQAAKDLDCPRDEVVPYMLNQSSAFKHGLKHLWRAEGCGRIARYDAWFNGANTLPRLVLGSVDLPCAGCPCVGSGCDCIDKYLGSFRLWEHEPTVPYAKPDATLLHAEGPISLGVFERRGETWRRICEAGCNTPVDPKGTYRGERYGNYSAPFQLPAGARWVTIHVNEGSDRCPTVEIMGSPAAPTGRRPSSSGEISPIMRKMGAPFHSASRRGLAAL
jgi:hypothetical protein